ncbi:MAG: saccharopine dehydrogenase NADP-binding domain-containing protein [Saprospirales bacterium]|nr:saccharopine dehydrogenase NADP-binding domain-containing protein [Saprospirales bacterium]
MKNITILGAGRSATALIKYALKIAGEKGWNITVADSNLEMASKKVANHPNGRAVFLDANDTMERQNLLRQADLVISLLPPFMHPLVANDCVHLGRHLVNASYLSKELQQLDQVVREKGLTFMGEMGLDPGIDHMSAMQKIHEIRAKGGELTAFRSFTGGLIAPESDDNPWHYKFTWNPRNVVLAGQGTAQYLEEGMIKYIPYQRLFRRYNTIEVDGLGEYEVYANRDSLPYRELYDLQNIPNLLRGTIRVRGFCDAWNALAQIGLTDDTFTLSHTRNWTYSDWLESYCHKSHPASLKERIARLLGEDTGSDVMQKLEWLGLFSQERIPDIKDPTPAMVLEDLLLKKWSLKPDDKDMIIMQHQFEYRLNGETRKLTSTLVMKGTDEHDTAMARLVGLPLGIFSKILLEGNIQCPGVHIPVMPEVYEPVLAELANHGVAFMDREEVLAT